MRHEPEAGNRERPIDHRRGGAAMEVLDTIFRQKKLLLTLFTLLAIGMGAYLVFAPRTYEAEMSILVKSRRADLMFSPSANPERPETINFDSIFATEVQMLTSQELLRDVVALCGLQRRGESTDKAVARLSKVLNAAPVLKSNLIRVTYSDIDPVRAAKVLKTLSDRYLEKYISVHSSPGSMQFFEKQASEAQTRLTELQAKLTGYQSKVNIVILNEQKDLLLKKIMELESAQRDTQVLIRENDPRMETIRGQLTQARPRITTARRQIPNQYSVERMNTLLVDLQNRRTEMATKFRSDDRLVTQLDQQISDTRHALESARSTVSTEETTDVNPLRQTLEAELAKGQSTASGLHGRSAILERQARECRTELAKLELATPQDKELVRAVALAEENYLLYAKKLEEARIADELDRKQITNVQLVDPPLVPAEPKGRVRPVTLGVGMLGTLSILMIAFVRGHRRLELSTPWDVEDAVDVPVVATVPLAPMPPQGSGQKAAAAKAGSKE